MRKKTVVFTHNLKDTKHLCFYIMHYQEQILLWHTSSLHPRVWQKAHSTHLLHDKALCTKCVKILVLCNSVLTCLCLFYRYVQSLALAGHLGLDHITVNKWIRELGRSKKKRTLLNSQTGATVSETMEHRSLHSHNINTGQNFKAFSWYTKKFVTHSKYKAQNDLQKRLS